MITEINVKYQYLNKGFWGFGEQYVTEP
jgi:hypothetical protein